MSWDLDLAKRLQHAGRSFELSLACRSAAPRLALFGPSGAGKTLALNLIAGLVKPERGHVRVGGTSLFDAGAGIDLSPQQRRLACVFQDYALFPHLTVRQNLAFAAARGWRNPARDAAPAEVERWLDSFGLRAVEHQYPVQLSGGQRQRTALARALVGRPRALLLDEPFAALDRRLRARLVAELAELQAALAMPMLLVTHDEDDLRHLADTVVHLDAGRLAAEPARAA